ncbi:MAG TPA: hypothetical protein O0X01_04250 [Methanocorpusculum sp.]|nr:hypothetical protein [Methanocorpusculum sp.]
MSLEAILSNPDAIIAWVITIGIPLIAAVILGYQKSGLKGAFAAFVDGMDPSIPQTEAQTEVIESVPESIWKMDDAMYAELVKQLTASGAKFNENGLRHVIDDMESKTQVEYGILVEDHDGNPDTSCKSAFVSYGSFTLLSYNQVVNTCRNRGGALVTAISN